jgi:hypothetical protein
MKFGSEVSFRVKTTSAATRSHNERAINSFMISLVPP